MRHSYFVTAMVFTAWIIVTVGCLKPKAPVYYDFVNFKIDSIGKVQSVVSAELKYFNPNNYNLQLKQGEVDVYLNQKLAGHSVLDSMILIPKKDTFYLPVKMRVNMSAIFSNALNILLNNEMDIKLQGKAKVGRSGIFMNLPILYEGKQRIPL
ncbi:MAG: LEA type 2 family protein [Chitinophagaceae bacterium]|nr:LEA type 2 family protein [Chitinophagaceae bacterium]